MPPTITPEDLHRLAHTAHAAGWGPEGVMPTWLDQVADEYVTTAGRLRLMAAAARRAQTGVALVGIGGQ